MPARVLDRKPSLVEFNEKSRRAKIIQFGRLSSKQISLTELAVFWKIK